MIHSLTSSIYFAILKSPYIAHHFVTNFCIFGYDEIFLSGLYTLRWKMMCFYIYGSWFRMCKIHCINVMPITCLTFVPPRQQIYLWHGECKSRCTNRKLKYHRRQGKFPCGYYVKTAVVQSSRSLHVHV